MEKTQAASAAVQKTWTEEEKLALQKEIADRFMGYLLRGETENNDAKMIEMAKWLYSFVGLTPPTVYITDSPVAAQKLANVLDQEFLKKLQDIPGYSPELSTEEKFKLIPRGDVQYYSFCYYGSISDYSWVANYRYFNQIGETNNEGADRMEEYFRSGIYDAIQFEEACILVRMPVRVSFEDGNLHNTQGAALEFRDGIKGYFIRGRNIDPKLAEKCLEGRLTREEFINEKNEENRAAMFAYVGQVNMCQLLGAREVSVRQTVHGNGEMETIKLLRTDEKFREIGNKPLAWLHRVCPSTGNIYMTPTKPDFEDAIEAAKFHRGVQGVEGLDYIWHSRS